MRRLVRIVVVTALLLAGGACAQASTIVYQCGPGVCAIDPDAGAPHQLAAQGRSVGITRDGTTAAWVDPSGHLVQAPAAGGAATTIYTGAVGNEPVMSPDGRQFLWWQPGPSVIFGGTDVYVYRLVAGTTEPQSISQCVECTTTHGFLGSTAMAAFPAETSSGEPSEVCRIDSTPGSSCVQKLVADPRGGMSFPTGSPDGTQILAVVVPGSGDGTPFRGHLALYSVATGGLVRDITTATPDTTPAWSADGSRIAFERAGTIVVRTLATGAEKTVAAGINPSWGGATAGKVTLTLPARKRRGRVSGWRTLRGTATGATVQVNVVRRSGRSCRAYTGKKFAKASCSGAATRFVSVTVSSGRWSLRLRGLSAGRYTVRVRAEGARTVMRSLRLRR